MNFDLHEYDEVTSTNDLIKEVILSGEREGYCVCARRQSGGYGRRGNSWASEPGGLYLSLLLRPNNDTSALATLSLAIAIAVRRTLDSFLPADLAGVVKIKWPNDVVVDVRDTRPEEPADSFKFNKICGISLEGVGGAVCIGIGINIDVPQSQIGNELFASSKNTPCYLNDLLRERKMQPVDITVVRDRLLDNISDVYEQWMSTGFESLRAEYQEYSALNDMDICVDNTGLDAPVYGRAVGVNCDGHLIVKTADDGNARQIEIAAGTITIQQ